HPSSRTIVGGHAGFAGLAHPTNISMIAVLPLHLTLAHGRAVMADDATGGGAQIAVMAGVMADRAADEGALQASLGESGRRGQRQRDCHAHAGKNGSHDPSSGLCSIHNAEEARSFRSRYCLSASRNPSATTARPASW